MARPESAIDREHMRLLRSRAGKDFTPFGVGLVQLGLPDEAVIWVEGRFTEKDPAKLQFGMNAGLTMVPFTTEEDGDELVTFAFRPA